MNRLILRLMRVKIGKNLKTRSATSVENPSAISIGNNVWISKNVALSAMNGIKIGDDVTIAKDVSLISGDHEFSDLKKKINQQGMKKNRKPIIISDDVWIGEKVTILKSVTIGRGSVIGAASVVTKDIPPFSIAVGNPARVIKKRGGKKS